MSILKRRQNERPELEHERIGREAAFPKPRRSDRAGAVDTSDLALRKIHPEELPELRAFVRRLKCSIAGHRLHPKCWSPESSRGLSDPAHVGKALSGKLKQTDVRGLFPLCRLAHDEQELNADAFDQKYSIDRYEIASRQYDAFLAEQEKKNR